MNSRLFYSTASPAARRSSRLIVTEAIHDPVSSRLFETRASFPRRSATAPRSRHSDRPRRRRKRQLAQDLDYIAVGRRRRGQKPRRRRCAPRLDKARLLLSTARSGFVAPTTACDIGTRRRIIPVPSPAVIRVEGITRRRWRSPTWTPSFGLLVGHCYHLAEIRGNPFSSAMRRRRGHVW